MIYGEYEVTGKRRYRGHEPGVIFEAVHDRPKERAIGRGDITLLRLITPAAPTNGTLPRGCKAGPAVQPQANRQGG